MASVSRFALTCKTDFSRRTVAQSMLRVDASSPETQIAPEFLLEFLRIHSPGAGLERVQDIHADFNEIGNYLADGAARVEQDLDIRRGFF